MRQDGFLLSSRPLNASVIARRRSRPARFRAAEGLVLYGREHDGICSKGTADLSAMSPRDFVPSVPRGNPLASSKMLPLPHLSGSVLPGRGSGRLVCDRINVLFLRAEPTNRSIEPFIAHTVDALQFQRSAHPIWQAITSIWAIDSHPQRLMGKEGRKKVACQLTRRRESSPTAPVAGLPRLSHPDQIVAQYSELLIGITAAILQLRGPVLFAELVDDPRLIVRHDPLAETMQQLVDGESLLGRPVVRNLE
jgi:hypothetical protein